MTHFAMPRSLRASAVLLALVAGCSSAVESHPDGDVAVQGLELKREPPVVPAKLAVPAGNHLALALDAAGDQIYVCQQQATTGAYAWTLRAPDADLFKPNGGIAGSHYAGPTWEYLDGSTVVGARVDGVTVDATAVPWLLLRAVSNSEDGRFSRVSFIQRLDTVGGLAPAPDTCDAARATTEMPVSYTAVYYFYVPDHGEG